MKIVADLILCDGYANCVIAAEDIFSIDDNGKVEILNVSPPEDRREAVEEAVRNCPVKALSLVEE